jgi:hypothetical protein
MRYVLVFINAEILFIHFDLNLSQAQTFTTFFRNNRHLRVSISRPLLDETTEILLMFLCLLYSLNFKPRNVTTYQNTIFFFRFDLQKSRKQIPTAQAKSHHSHNARNV